MKELFSPSRALARELWRQKTDAEIRGYVRGRIEEARSAAREDKLRLRRMSRAKRKRVLAGRRKAVAQALHRLWRRTPMPPIERPTLEECMELGK